MELYQCKAKPKNNLISITAARTVIVTQLQHHLQVKNNKQNAIFLKSGTSLTFLIWKYYSLFMNN